MRIGYEPVRCPISVYAHRASWMNSIAPTAHPPGDSCLAIQGRVCNRTLLLMVSTNPVEARRRLGNTLTTRHPTNHLGKWTIRVPMSCSVDIRPTGHHATWPTPYISPIIPVEEPEEVNHGSRGVGHPHVMSECLTNPEEVADLVGRVHDYRQTE